MNDLPCAGRTLSPFFVHKVHELVDYMDYMDFMDKNGDHYTKDFRTKPMRPLFVSLCLRVFVLNISKLVLPFPVKIKHKETKTQRHKEGAHRVSAKPHSVCLTPPLSMSATSVYNNTCSLK